MFPRNDGRLATEGAAAHRGLELTRPGLVCLTILLLAFGLRVYQLDAQSLWYDEAVSAQVAAKGLAELTRWTANDIQPPLYYYLLSGWTRIAGYSEWALRFPSAAFGVLTVALLWSAGRRIFRQRDSVLPAALVALLAAASPLHLYYGQEARMYTQLVFFGTAAGYALWRAIEGRRWQWWAAFVLTALAALYTHYFALFLLVAYGLCAILALATGRTPGAGKLATRWLSLAGAFALIAIGYLPWLPAMLTRYRVDASYWQGELKLGEALRHIAISLTVGAPETILEGDAVRWLPWFALALLVALAGLALSSWRRRAALLLVVLVVPVILVLVLASRNPKFNPRYLMLASPAYLLLLAGGAAAWFERAHGGLARRARPALAALPAVILAPALITSVVGWANWFGDPAFTKAQWRQLAAYVRSEIGPDERVVLVSGHAAPAWDYYAADLSPLRLPEIDVLDVNAVLGFDAGAAFAQGLSGADGAWLVTWQDEVADPVGFAPYFLGRAGQEQTVDRSFWHLGLRHFALRPDATYPTEPQPQHDQDANFDHKLALLGWDDPQDGLLTVYWRGLNTLPADYQVSLIVEDAAGNEVGRWDGRPATYDYPTTRWAVGEAVFGRYPLPLSGGAAGDYYVSLAVYAPDAPEGLDIRDVADNPAGKRIRLGPM